VKEVKLSSNGKTATVELFAQEDATEVLKNLRDYTVTVKVDGETLKSTFNRSDWREDVITSVSSEDKEITVAGKKLEITDDKFDYQDALGRTARVWFNQDNEVVKVAFEEDETVKYDAVEITDTDEVKLLTEDKKYDTAEEGLRFYLDGQLINVDNDGDLTDTIPANLDGDEYDFAKVVLNEDGDVAFVYAYNWENYLVVDEVKADTLVGVDGTADFDAEDAIIIKDGKEIALSDVKAGDVVFFNSRARGGDGVAEVATTTVKGSIETIYNKSIEVDGKLYDFLGASDKYGDADYKDKSGDVTEIDADAAEELQAGGEVTLFLDRKGDLVYVAGDVADVDSNTFYGYVENVGDLVGYKQAGKDRLEVTLINEKKEEVVKDFALADLDTVTIDGEEYDLDDTPEAGDYKLVLEDLNNSVYDTVTLKRADNNGVLQNVVIGGNTVKIALDTFTGIVNVELDDNNNVEGIEVFSQNDLFGDEGYATFTNLEADDKYVAGKLLSSSTLVFELDSDGDVKKVTTWGELKGTDITAGTAYYDDENKATVIVANDTDAEDVKEEKAFVTEAYFNKDKELVKADVIIDGKAVTLTADELTGLYGSFDEGVVALLEINETTNEINSVISVNNAAYSDKNQRVVNNNVNVGNDTVQLTSGTFKLTNDGYVLDATDLDDVTVEASVSALKDLDADERVTVIKGAGGFAEAFIITKAADTNNAPTDNVTSVNQNENTVLTYAGSALAADVDVYDTLSVVGPVTSSNTAVATVAVTQDGKLQVTTSEVAPAGATATITANVTDGTATTQVQFTLNVADVVTP
jgi:trimeric autotransporter adhesin